MEGIDIDEGTYFESELKRPDIGIDSLLDDASDRNDGEF